jgi:hypothetical protein
MRQMKDPVLVYHDFNVMVLPESTIWWNVVHETSLPMFGGWDRMELPQPYDTFPIKRYVHNSLIYHIVEHEKNFLSNAIPFVLMTAGQAVSDFKEQQQLDVWTPIEIIWDMVSEDPNVSDLLYASVRLIARQ